MLNESGFRKPNDTEIGLMDRLISVEFPGREVIAHQLANSLVREFDDCEILKFGSLELRTTAQTPAPVLGFVPVEAEAVDTDGVTIHIRLHVASGFVREIEVFKSDESDVNVVPDMSYVKVIVNKSD